jgi:hypothetical protein
MHLLGQQETWDWFPVAPDMTRADRQAANGPKHVRVDCADAGPLGDRAHPAVGGAPVEAAAVVAGQDRPRRPLADGQVDGPGRPGHQRDHGGLVALADDAQGPVASLEAEVLDVGRARHSPAGR